eukprot:CAMPEP_0198222686 /NCGR_PEP_ID=MMETSP1445-20131203/89210_1 /TAXON_ID=36898 /ORGANISM="Pyramimonas sp., Strain CCMP2087" /LENGTH=83 /DNA_ID=CAMNT_0043901279 /DNA_START=95 /DNA_END=346 /DNA_ORIENTATION=+
MAAGLQSGADQSGLPAWLLPSTPRKENREDRSGDDGSQAGGRDYNGDRRVEDVVATAAAAASAPAGEPRHDSSRMGIVRKRYY